MDPGDKVLSLGKLAVSNVEKDYMEIHAMPNAPRPGHDSMVVMIFKGLNPELKPLDPLQSLPELRFHRGKMGIWQGFAGAINVCMKAWEAGLLVLQLVGPHLQILCQENVDPSSPPSFLVLPDCRLECDSATVGYASQTQWWQSGRTGLKGLPHFGVFSGPSAKVGDLPATK